MKIRCQYSGKLTSPIWVKDQLKEVKEKWLLAEDLQTMTARKHWTRGYWRARGAIDSQVAMLAYIRLKRIMAEQSAVEITQLLNQNHFSKTEWTGTTMIEKDDKATNKVTGLNLAKGTGVAKNTVFRTTSKQASPRHLVMEETKLKVWVQWATQAKSVEPILKQHLESIIRTYWTR